MEHNTGIRYLIRWGFIESHLLGKTFNQNFLEGQEVPPLVSRVTK